MASNVCRFPLTPWLYSYSGIKPPKSSTCQIHPPSLLYVPFLGNKCTYSSVSRGAQRELSAGFVLPLNLHQPHHPIISTLLMLLGRVFVWAGESCRPWQALARDNVGGGYWICLHSWVWGGNEFRLVDMRCAAPLGFRV